MYSFGRRRRSRSRKQSRRSRRRSRRSRRRSRRSVVIKLSKRRGPRGGKRYLKPKGMSCKEFLGRKIAENMRELKKGKFSSRAQAIAVSYSQVRASGCRLKKK